MRRLFIIRKDLNLKPGKLSAMIGHLCEAYWTNILKKSISPWKKENERGQQLCYVCNLELPIDVVDEYVFGIFTKTICEAKNLNDLLKVKTYIDNINKIMLPEYSLKSNTEKIERQLQNETFEVQDILKLPLVEGVDYGWINDKCLTDLTPENPDGTTTIGIWFRPLPDGIAHKISKKYKLYGAFDGKNKPFTWYEVNETAYGGPDETSYERYGRYSSYEEAKKDFEYRVEHHVKGNDVFNKNITVLSEDKCEYTDGGSWSYSLGIYKHTIDDIKERFVVS